ncbi:hypothetical protein [Legionella spiritensis]|uniref:Uncharacterized protein n=1 Tax=Legionella spiritensis TaxID=452 RepID=A0A0W0YY95_LEGSP|nr:hypothetical protein [Legionella spiritensis]KTD61882.1 hypothetical protein Lspi_2512 [Legionella spiritensis]SNV45438.1 Uncharacterised protein [Legionella spiritensis]
MALSFFSKADLFIVKKILGNSQKELLNFSVLCKETNAFVHELIIESSGTKNWDDYVTTMRIKKLDIRLQKMVNEGYNLSLAEDIQHIWNLDRDNRFKALVPEEQKENYSPIDFSSDNVIMALREGLVSLEQLRSDFDWDSDKLSIKSILLKGNCLQALREKLITIEQFESLPITNRRGALEIPEWEHIDHLLGDIGINALREGLVTFDQVKKLPAKSLTHLFSENGMQALREKLITLEMLNNKQELHYFSYLVTDNGLQALREKLISYEQTMDLPEHTGYLDALFSDNGIQALREELITPEEAFAMRSHFALCDLLEKLNSKPCLISPN